MRWEDERYVRVYTRDTVDWLALSFEAQALFPLILRKVDRAGLMSLGRHGKRAVAIAIGHGARWDVIGPALEELLVDGCVRIEGETLIVPNFIEAQEAIQSDAQRKRESRAKARDIAAAGAPTGPDASRNVTEESRNVTECPAPVTPSHAESRAVTPSCAVPSLAEPSSAADAARSPSAVERPAVSPRSAPPRWPKASQLFRHALCRVGTLATPEDALWRTVEDAVERAGLEASLAAVDAICDREIGKGKAITTLAYFVKGLQALPLGKPKRAKGENPSPGDTDFDDPNAWWSLSAFRARPRAQGVA